MNFLRQGFRKLLYDIQTDGRTDAQTDAIETVATPLRGSQKYEINICIAR